VYADNLRSTIVHVAMMRDRRSKIAFFDKARSICKLTSAHNSYCTFFNTLSWSKLHCQALGLIPAARVNIGGKTTSDSEGVMLWQRVVLL
jgi:hypothetical protein